MVLMLLCSCIVIVSLTPIVTGGNSRYGLSHRIQGAAKQITVILIKKSGTPSNYYVIGFF